MMRTCALREYQREWLRRKRAREHRLSPPLPRCPLCGARKTHRIGRLCGECNRRGRGIQLCECGRPKSRGWRRCHVCFLADCELTHRYPGIAAL